jgi:hypothetical protein
MLALEAQMSFEEVLDDKGDIGGWVECTKNDDNIDWFSSCVERNTFLRNCCKNYFFSFPS